MRESDVKHAPGLSAGMLKGGSGEDATCLRLKACLESEVC